MIVDPFGNIRIVLWGGLCEKDLTVGKTYIFKIFNIESPIIVTILNRQKS